MQISTIDVGNPASNVIPASARATFNIRFNDRHSSDGLTRWLRERFDVAVGEPAGGKSAAAGYDLKIHVSGESFLTPPGPLSDIIADAVSAELGVRPELSTTGGTSDARFIKDYCPVAEFGLVGQTMHKADERMAVADLEALTRIYRGVLERVFAE